jgi:hypothetical protein
MACAELPAFKISSSIGVEESRQNQSLAAPTSREAKAAVPGSAPAASAAEDQAETVRGASELRFERSA